MRQYLGYMTIREQRDADELISEVCDLLSTLGSRQSATEIETMIRKLDAFRRRDEEEHKQLLDKIKEVCEPFVHMPFRMHNIDRRHNLPGKES